MFRVSVYGGYSGRHGSITASREIEIPFAPFAGLHLETDEWMATIDDVTWILHEAKFVAFAVDCGDLDSRDLSKWELHFRTAGWNILEIDPVMEHEP